MPFFQRGHPRCSLRSGLGCQIALGAQYHQLFLPRRNLQFELSASLLDRCQFRLSRCDQGVLLPTFSGQPLEFALADINPLADAGHFSIQLLQQMSRCHHLLLCLALLVFQALQQGSVLFDFAPQGKHE